MDFPHLKDTRFPNLDTVDVYKFQNTFDYMRWLPETKIKLVNVLWNSDYNDTVKFDTNIERDGYFDAISDYYALQLETDQRMLPDAERGMSVKLPIPFDVAARYNYLYIDYPIATGENLIDYENDNGVRRWYFFIMDIDSLAPNTTRFYLSLDYWTNYINDCDINYLQLERGHAPVAYSDTDDYLNNPIEHNEFLLSPDINFGNTTICKNSKFIPYGNEKKYLCLISLCAPWQIATLGHVTADENYTWSNPVFSDGTGRWGYQIEVDGYGYGNGYNYGALNTTNISVTESSLFRIPNGHYMYAIDAALIYSNDNNTVFNKIKAQQPNFFKTIKGCFVISEDLLSFNGITVDICGYEFKECYGNHEFSVMQNFKFEKDMFGYAEDYQRFAKLYTFPYAYAEFTDNNGKSFEVHIENTSTINAISTVALAFPFMNYRIFFDGINGSGNKKYTWMDLRDYTHKYHNMPNSDWYECCFDWDIPVYALFIDGQTDYLASNFNSDMKNARVRALTEYKNTVRQADNVCENAKDLADVANTNAHAKANVVDANAANTAACNTANANATNATNTANTTAANDAKIMQYGYTGNYKSQCKNAANSVNVAATNVNNETTVATTSNNAIAGILTGAIGGLGGSAGAGASMGGVEGAGMVLGGALVGFTNGLINADAAMTNASIVTQANSQVVGLTNGKNDTEYAAGVTYDANSTANANALQSTTTSNNNALLSTQTANNNNCLLSNAGNTSGMMRANGDRNEAVADSNATYTRNAAVKNAQETLKQKQRDINSKYGDIRNKPPVQIGQYSGDPTNDYMQNRGIQIKIRTQSKNAIKQTSDFFARYGYALNQYWDVKNSGFNVMKNFSYWKASDVWIDDRVSSTNLAQDAIIAILKNGTTVWKNPEKIGKVSIYDN